MNEKLEAKVLTRLSNSSKTSYAVAADLSEMELKKILIEKMEGNKSIHRSNEQRNLYKALVEAYDSDKIILDTYEDTITLKRRRDDDTSASKSAIVEEPMQTTFEMEEPSHLEFETCADDQPIVEPSQHPEWFSQQNKPPTPDRDSNKTFLATHGSIQSWISKLAKQYDSRSYFNELMDTPVDFSAFLMNRLSIVIQRRIEDLQLGVESYQKKLNLTSSDTYRSDLTRKEAYSTYSNLRGFIYQNKDKQNRLMQIDELHKFSDGTLTDVRTALDDHLKGIQMKYMPKSIWRKSDKDRAAAMIQAIDKMLKTRRIMRSLERFVGGRLYEGDFRMLQRTI
nr:hypothetical protein [Tanacetum cinerariifolium]